MNCFAVPRLVAPRLYKPCRNLTRFVSTSLMDQLNVSDEAEPVQIPMPWGQISGKWWGPRDVRPIVCLHGWQDNAGTFDTLIPLLPKQLSYLAIDLPGHGLSSRYPPGMNYAGLDSLILLERICQEYNWNKISLMGHSMGSIISFNYSGVFPDKVDLVVGIDALKSHIRKPEHVPILLEGSIQKLIETDALNQSNKEPPSYYLSDMIDKWHEATAGSVTKECCKYLLARNIERSQLHPDKFFFSRDSRWKYAYSIHVPQEVSMEMVKRMKMPYLFIKATNSPYYEDKSIFRETIQFMKQCNEHFQWHLVEGTHHLHLTNPNSVAKLISTFLTKNRKDLMGNSKL